MQADLKIKNIVLVGSFDLPLLDKFFFIKNNIIKEEEILNIPTFNPLGGISNLDTEKFRIIINFNQLIISNQINDLNNDISKIALSIIKAANLNNIVALGINFNWTLEDHSKSLTKLSKSHFYNEKMELFSKFFSSSDSLFGVYASTNIKDARLKLDIKPIIMMDNNNSIDAINFNFNFHFEINAIDKLIKCIADYNFYKEESQKMISIYQ